MNGLNISRKFFYSILYFLLLPIFFPLKTIPNTLNTKNFQYSKNYVLGIGDGVLINFEGIAIYTKTYFVQTDGYLKLPELGLVKAKDKTLLELQNILLDKYQEYIINPKIDLEVSYFRPINVTINGEVNRPGLYTINYGANQTNQVNTLNFKSKESPELTPQSINKSQSPPKLFDLIQASKGVTPNANISEIEIVRKNPEINGGGKLRAKVNLVALLSEGDQEQNINLFDGDHIFIPISNESILNQLIDINRSNLSPDQIEVFMNGNVSFRGRLVIKQGSSLHEAIAAAGGANSLTGNIEFIRLTKNGETNKRIIRFKKSAKKGSKENPILLAGDIINVKRNIMGKFGGIITDYTSPLINAYGIYKIFE